MSPSEKKEARLICHECLNIRGELFPNSSFIKEKGSCSSPYKVSHVVGYLICCVLHYIDFTIILTLYKSSGLVLLYTCVCVCSVMSDSLQPQELQPARLLYPWDFSWQEYWNGLPYSPPGDFPNSGIKPVAPASLALAGKFFTIASPGKSCLCLDKYDLYYHQTSFLSTILLNSQTSRLLTVLLTFRTLGKFLLLPGLQFLFSSHKIRVLNETRKLIK